ncbi:MAG: hypothetical protein ABH967_02610 [Patescibacteria group bacterium]
MNFLFKKLNSILTFSIILGAFFIVSPVLESKAKTIPESIQEQTENLAIIEKNSLLPLASISKFNENNRIVKVIVTAYSSTVMETDSTPFITASGKMVADGIVANNLLKFGTKVKIPELYGNKIFVVQDRMNSKKSDYHVDIWFPSRQEALDFGAKITYMEILGN